MFVFKQRKENLHTQQKKTHVFFLRWSGTNLNGVYWEKRKSFQAGHSLFTHPLSYFVPFQNKKLTNHRTNIYLFLERWKHINSIFNNPTNTISIDWLFSPSFFKFTKKKLSESFQHVTAVQYTHASDNDIFCSCVRIV